MLFINLLISSTLITISSLSWFTAWMGLEMNLLSILPLMKTKMNKLTAEASIKYFIIQAMASACLLFSIIFFSNLNILMLSFNSLNSIILNLALILKMGAAPLHFWLPEIISGLEWMSAFTVLTWQKIAPMILLFYSLENTLFISLIILLSSLVGGIQGLNQSCLRKIMAYSSINHMSWMICAMISSLNLWLYYFLIYAITNLWMISMFNKFRIFQINQMSKLFSFNKPMKFFFTLNFFSLGGLPPFTGFLPKWLTLNFLINMNHNALSLTLVITTLMALYFYCRVMFSSITLSYSESLINPLTHKFSSLYFSLNMLTLSILPLAFSLSSLF
uniref:NADH-ubiquinone oxidoreductase chain 2 n=1 Tax=Trigonopterus sp. 1 AH-2016 TaxID=1903835 RepID=A0A343C5C3_9CUCU|nr:NADH dehydrogenase subunit 2 [Trigonopterus sp. 1 AH-2016]